MTQIVTNDFSVKVIRSPRRKTMALSIKDAEVIVRMPTRLPLHHAEAFVAQKSNWIKQKLAQQQPVLTRQFENDERFHYLGRELTLSIRSSANQNKVECVDSSLLLSCKTVQPTSNALERQLTRWYRVQAERHLLQRSEELANLTGLVPRSVTVKSYKARWGSCRMNGDIQLNWKLIMAPPEVIDYVIIHELCHLEQHNHSAAFWHLVQTHCPSFQHHRNWLKQFGAQLSL